MNIRCPNCGAVHSLDALISDAAASELLKMVLAMDADMGSAAIRYLGLFRPAKSQLSWGRLVTLLKELLPDMQAQQFKRDGFTYSAPPAAWLYGFNVVLAARESGRVKTPLKSHGYLFEVMSGWQSHVAFAHADATPTPAAEPTSQGSKLRQGVAALADWAGNDVLRKAIAGGFTQMAMGNMRGKPAAVDMAIIAEQWLQRLLEKESFIAELDVPRLQTAFTTLRDAAEWPNVTVFMKLMPPRLFPRTMIEQKVERSDATAEIASLKEILKGK